MLAWLLACTSPEPSGSIATDPDLRVLVPSAPPEELPTTDSDPPVPDPLVTIEDAGGQDLVALADWIFSDEVVHEVALTIDAKGWNALQDDPYTSVEALVTIDDVNVGRVGVHQRGKIGSFRNLGDKPKLRIDFNFAVENQRYWGLEALLLNNCVQDPTYLHDQIVGQLYEAVGVPTHRSGYATLLLNGEDYGLYTLSEEQDDRFLERHWSPGLGNLYDGKYVYYGGWSYTLLDFDSGVDELYELEEGTDVGNADIINISTIVSDTWGTDDFYEALEPFVDWESVHREWAMQWFIGHVDGYLMNTNNNRVYFDPDKGGRMTMMSTDFDNTFLADSWWGMDWNHPSGRLGTGCRRDTDCVSRQVEVTQEIVDELALTDWALLVEEQRTLVEALIEADPKRDHALSTVNSYTSSLLNWVTNRGSEIDEMWGEP